MLDNWPFFELKDEDLIVLELRWYPYRVALCRISRGNSWRSSSDIDIFNLTRGTTEVGSDFCLRRASVPFAQLGFLKLISETFLVTVNSNITVASKMTRQ
jgi:hypothetical protein